MQNLIKMVGDKKMTQFNVELGHAARVAAESLARIPCIAADADHRTLSLYIN